MQQPVARFQGKNQHDATSILRRDAKQHHGRDYEASFTRLAKQSRSPQFTSPLPPLFRLPLPGINRSSPMLPTTANAAP